MESVPPRARPQNVRKDFRDRTWRGFEGHAPVLDIHALTRAALANAGRFERLLTEALPPPYV